MTVNYPKNRNEVTLAKDILDEIIEEAEREDFDQLDTPTCIELPLSELSGSDASFPDRTDRKFKSSRIR